MAMDDDFFVEPKQFQITHRFSPIGLNSTLNCRTDMIWSTLN